MGRTDTAFAQRSQKKLHFDHKDMDYYLAWIMGRTIYGGCNPTECLDVAKTITNGDVISWQKQWLALAQRVEAEADTAYHNGDLEHARSRYLHACTYYRAPLFIMKPAAPDFDVCEQKMRSCFRMALPLLDSPIEPVEVPFKAQTLSGYLWKGDASAEKRPTLVVFGGIETYAEDCYFMIGSSGSQRGYNVVTIDLPGQGMTPKHGLYFGAKMERPVTAVLDYLLGFPEVDADRVAIYGFSWGGHIVFKAAYSDRRIKAMIANPPMPNVFRAVLAQQQGHDRSDPVARTVFEQIAWRMGVKISFNPRDIARRFGKAYDYFFYGKVDPAGITCPVLCLAGEGEAAITLQITQECYERLPHPQKMMRIFTAEEGGEAHCQVNNLALPNSVIFDWLDQVLV